MEKKQEKLKKQMEEMYKKAYTKPSASSSMRSGKN
jgi:hypothetical protein